MIITIVTYITIQASHYFDNNYHNRCNYSSLIILFLVFSLFTVGLKKIYVFVCIQTMLNEYCCVCWFLMQFWWISVLCSTVSNVVPPGYVEEQCVVLPPFSSQLPHPCKFSMLFQHQSVVGSSGPHNPCFPQFQHCCPLHMELTPICHSHLFVITHIPSSS